MLMLILPGKGGKIAPTLLIPIISGTTQGGDGEALYCNLSLSGGFQMGSEGGVGYSLLTGRALTTQLYCEMKQGCNMMKYYNYCGKYIISCKRINTVFFNIWRRARQQDKPKTDDYRIIINHSLEFFFFFLILVSNIRQYRQNNINI